MLEQPPLSLYIHIPWCLRKCPYCDFNSHAATSELPEQEYVSALCQDLDADLGLLELADFSGFHSVFICGGTPSLFSARAYEQLLDHIREKAGIERGAEITLEVNPGAAEAEKFRGYRKQESIASPLVFRVFTRIIWPSLAEFTRTRGRKSH